MSQKSTPINLLYADERIRATPIAFGFTSMASVSRYMALCARARVVYDLRRLERLSDRRTAAQASRSD